MRRYYGMSLAEVRRAPISELVELVAWLPSDAAVHRATDPDWWITPAIELAQRIEQGVRVAAWIHSKDADPKAPRNFPQPMPLTKAQRDADEARRDAGSFGDASKYRQMTIEEARVFLGW